MSEELETKSPISKALAVFKLNTSQHADNAPGCWYDSGDYTIFLHRNTEAVFYLSLAYSESKNINVRAELKRTINDQLTCIESMISQNIKQFRDMDNHGINLPPKWNAFFYPNKTHQLEEGEGRDVFLFLSLIYQNMGDSKQSAYYAEQAEKLQRKTVSSNCCEYGPLTLSENQLAGLEYLVFTPDEMYKEQETWGINPESLAVLASGNKEAVSGMLLYLEKHIDASGNPFHYLGGNYDIAGTIALERMYVQQTGDLSYNNVSAKLWNYLHGENAYRYSFTDPDFIYHPCYFFHACTLPDTLINGVAENGILNVESWQNGEVQLIGQAKYILAKVLYNQL